MKNVTLHELELLTGTSYQVLKELLAPGALFQMNRWPARSQPRFRIASTEASRLSGKALYKIQVQRLIDIRVVSGNKKRSGDCKCV